MSKTPRIPNLGGARAFVLHRPHPTVQAIKRQLSAIGLEALECWPELPAEALAADFVFFDADLGFDEQFPWRPTLNSTIVGRGLLTSELVSVPNATRPLPSALLSGHRVVGLPISVNASRYWLAQS